MKGKILQKLLAIVNILTLTMVNFIFLGTSIVSYAADTITAQSSTNHKNVSFEAYFKDENGGKIYTNKAQISSTDVKLYVNIEVKQEGYFNGQISLGNSNFKINSTTSNQYINKIEDNKIVLNQINAGDKVELEISIQPIKNDSFNIGLLDMQSEINLGGTYKDSTQKDISIKATRNVELSLIAKYDDDTNPIELESTVLTNQIIKVSGEDKRVIQILTESGLKNNEAPIKNTTIEVASPVTDMSKIEKVEAYALSTNATNSSLKGDLTEKVSTDKENKKISLYIENNLNSNNEFEWKKSGNDQIIFTFICKEDAEVITGNLETNSKLNLYTTNNTSLTAWYQIGKIAESNGVVTIDSTYTEDSIYKGKLYAGIDREFTTKTNINVNLQNTIDNIIVKENAGEFYTDNTNIASSNIYYAKTTLNKSNLIDILGDNGTLTIYDQDGRIISTINKDTVADESGNIIVSYEDSQVKSIEIKTTAPVNKGTINIENTKIIKNTDANTIKAANQIRTVANLEYNKDVDTSKFTSGVSIATTERMLLEESSTQANIEINKNSLYALTENKDVEIRAILKTNSEKYDLYKNPTITFMLPEEVEKITLKGDAQLLYDDELKVVSTTQNGREIKVTLSGEQTKYNTYQTKEIEGATIVVNADVTLNKTATNGIKAITMTYTNEKANANINNSTITKEINIVSPQGVITVNNMEALGVETLGEETQKEITTKVSTGAKQVEVKTEVINNSGAEISNVSILGDFPTDGKLNVENAEQNNNMGVSVKTPITVDGMDAKVYYTQKDNATEDIQNSANEWTETMADSSKVRKYLVVVDTMKVADRISLNYTMEIPENLEYNKQAYQGYIVKYANGKTGSVESETSTYVKLTTGQGPVVEATLSATVGKDTLTENSVVKSGEVIKYNIQVKNTGSDVATDIKVIGNVPDGTTYVEPATMNIDGKEFSYQYIAGTYYQETDQKVKEYTIETLNSGETKNFEYEVRVNSDKTGIISNNAIIKYKDITKDTNKIVIKADKGNIRISVKSTADRDAQIAKYASIRYDAIVENISNIDQNNVVVEWNIPDEYEIISQSIDSISQDNKTNTVKIDNIKKGEKATISMVIMVEDVDLPKSVEIYATAKQSNDIYRSNVYEELIYGETLENKIEISSENENEYVKTGDIINYNITISNTSNTSNSSWITLNDTIPSELTVTKILINGEEQKIENMNNDIQIVLEMKANKSNTVTIQTVVDQDESRTNDVRISNKATLIENDGSQKDSNSISHIIEAEEIKDDIADDGDGNQDSEENGGNTSTGEDNKDNDESNIKGYKISGIAWLDENTDGQMQEQEQVLKGIEVKLLDINTNKIATNSEGKEITATTDDTGFYTLSGIGKGEYIVVFNYDSSKYILSTYKKDGVSESKNSDVVTKELNIDGTEKTYAVTDTINIENENKANINIGLIEAKIFDLKLDKYISRIIVQNSYGTSSYEYNKETLAKIELDSKKVNNSTVVLEYTIAVTNVGQLDGYVTNIVDYLPQSLKFSSELNKDWYQSGSNLYNSSFSNEKIKAGETKATTLVLTKTMTEENTGLINNTAEIAAAYNELDIKDTNSTPGNNVKGENDMGSADVIISLKTGKVVMYITLTIAILIIIGSTVFIIKKKVLNDKI